MSLLVAVALFGVLPADVAWPGKKDSDDYPSDPGAQMRALSDTVSTQAKRIASLEKQVSKLSAAGSCTSSESGNDSCTGSYDDDEPAELQPFRDAERRRARKRQLERLSAMFNITVGSPLTAIAISTQVCCLVAVA